MTGVAVGVALKIILMFGLCLSDYAAWRAQHGVPTLTYP